MRKPPITFENRMDIIKKSFITIAIVMSINFTASSVTFAQESKGYAPVNGLKLYYEVYGTAGVPLVLIHGGGSTIESSFGNILPLLVKHSKVIALELQAHGRTSDRDGALSFQQDADDVVGLLQYLKIDKADFFGFSNGGNTAMQVAIRHPEIVDKLIIASSFYKREGMVPGFFEGLEKASLDDMPAPLKTAYWKVAPDKDHLQVMFSKDRDRMVQFKDWSDEDIRSIKASTLLIFGDHDVVTPEHALEMFHILPHAKLMILPGTHGSYLGEVCTVDKTSKMTEMTSQMIEEFLRSN